MANEETAKVKKDVIELVEAYKRDGRAEFYHDTILEMLEFCMETDGEYLSREKANDWMRALLMMERDLTVIARG